MTYQPALAARPPMKQSAVARMDWLVPALLFPLFLVVMSVAYALAKAWTCVVHRR